MRINLHSFKTGPPKLEGLFLYISDFYIKCVIIPSNTEEETMAGVNYTTLLQGHEDPNSLLQRIARTYKLTENQRLFVKYYVEYNGNRMKALIDAGYGSHNKALVTDKNNKSEQAVKARTTLSVTGSILMKNKKIQKALQEYRESYVSEKKKDIEADVYRLAQTRATYDFRDFADVIVGDSPEEIAQKLRELPQELAVCIDSMSFKYHGSQAQKFTVDFKFADRQKSIEFLSKLTGLMVDKKEVKHEGQQMPTINIAVLNNDSKGDK